MKAEKERETGQEGGNPVELCAVHKEAALHISVMKPIRQTARQIHGADEMKYQRLDKG